MSSICGQFWNWFLWLLTSSLNLRFLNLAASVTFLYAWFLTDSLFLYCPRSQLMTALPPSLVEFVDLFSISLILSHSTSSDTMCISSEFICHSYFLYLMCSKLSFLWFSCYFSKWFPSFILFCLLEMSILQSMLALNSLAKNDLEFLILLPAPVLGLQCTLLYLALKVAHLKPVCPPPPKRHVYTHSPIHCKQINSKCFLLYAYSSQ